RFSTMFITPEYVLASALDPRTKLNVFKLQDTGGLILPTYSEAKSICNKEKENTEAIHFSEFEAYLTESVIPASRDILQYWKETEIKFPSLANHAKLYLAIPATSGSVER
ncbi:unnamed protein product, partial [Allacma fusca]